MTANAPVIFSEGIAITTTTDGAYRVEDIASGLPIGRVTSCEHESDPDDPGRIITELVIDTIGMTCTLRMDTTVVPATDGP